MCAQELLVGVDHFVQWLSQVDPLDEGTLHDLKGDVVVQLVDEVDHLTGHQVSHVKDAVKLLDLPGHLLQAGQLLPGAGQHPLHPLSPTHCYQLEFDNSDLQNKNFWA